MPTSHLLARAAAVAALFVVLGCLSTSCLSDWRERQISGSPLCCAKCASKLSSCDAHTWRPLVRPRRLRVEGLYSKKARLGPLAGLPLGGVGGLSSLIAAIQVSFMGCGVGGSSSTSSPLSVALGVPFELGGKGCISLGTMTRSLPSTRIAPGKATYMSAAALGLHVHGNALLIHKRTASAHIKTERILEQLMQAAGPGML